MSNVVGLCIIMDIEGKRAAEKVTKEGRCKRIWCGDFVFGALEYCLERGSLVDDDWARWGWGCVGHGGIAIPLVIKTNDGVVVGFLGWLRRNTVHRSVARILVRLVHGSIGSWDLGQGVARDRPGLGH